MSGSYFCLLSQFVLSTCESVCQLSDTTICVAQVLVLCFAVFLGSWAPTSLNIGYSNSRSSSGGDIFFQSPRLSRPSPAMGPQLKNVHVDAYSTSNCKYLLNVVSKTFCLSCISTLFWAGICVSNFVCVRRCRIMKIAQLMCLAWA